MAAIETLATFSYSELSDDLQEMVRGVMLLENGYSRRLINDVPLEYLIQGGVPLHSYLVANWGVEESTSIEDILLEQGDDVDLLIYKIFQEHNMTDHNLDGIQIYKGFW